MIKPTNPNSEFELARPVLNHDESEAQVSSTIQFACWTKEFTALR
ncbi:MAG TPA: hypothetical protein VHU62_14050 [Mycobacterium sp.]|nr:hypothetical protein [Mycobacterium sp.]